MTKEQARQLAELISTIATDAAYHSSDIYTSRMNLEEKLLEIFPETTDE